jgi:hypothetical protein
MIAKLKGPPRRRGGKHSNQWIKAKELGIPCKQKRQITPEREKLREQFWRKVANAARHYIETSPEGTASRMAEAIGVQHSQIHRFTCSICEHDQEPTFSVGMALLLYMSNHRTINFKVNEHSFVTLSRIRTTSKGKFEKLLLK